MIIRTTAGQRAGLRDALKKHGDKIRDEHQAIDGITADVHCDDLPAMAGMSGVVSISVDAIVRGDGAPPAAKSPAAKAAKPASQTSASTAKKAPSRAARRPARATAASKKAKSPRASSGDASLEMDPEAVALARARAIATEIEEEKARRSAQRKREATKAAQIQDRLFQTLGVKKERRKTLIEASSLTTGLYEAPTGDAGAVPDQTLRALLGVDATTAASGIGVAVIDSGIEPGTDFEGRISAFYDFTTGGARETAPSDEYGHGTHVAGLIGSQFVGIAPAVRLIGLKVLDASGAGRTSDVVRAIEFAMANKDALSIHVLNLSLGHPVFEPAATDPLVQVVEQAVRAGLVVVASAGNFGINPRTGMPGYAGVTSPGNAPSAVTVGALQTFDTVTRLDDRIGPYSSRGPSWYDGFAKPDVVAPGHALLSVAAAGSKLRAINEARGGSGNYVRLSGTSMAAGVASGLAALALNANGGLTPNALKAVLEFSAFPVEDDKGQYYDALTQGAGAVNGQGALELARAIDATQPVGTRWLTSGIPMYTVIGGEPMRWAQHMIWGNHFARGTGVIDENRPAWSPAVVWGEATGDDNIVWGNSDDNIVWGNSFDSDDNIVWGNNIVWADAWDQGDNIVWGNLFDDNIVWGNNVVWGNTLVGMVDDGDNIVWGNVDGDNIVWGNLADDNIVWGNLFDDNIVWGNASDDNIVWGNSVNWGSGKVKGKTPDNGSRAHRTRTWGGF